MKRFRFHIGHQTRTVGCCSKQLKLYKLESCKCFKWRTYTLIRVIIVFVLEISMFSSLFAQQSGGGYAGSWTARDFSARTGGLAGAFTAIADDPNAIYYNPAGLSNLPDVPTIISSVGLLGLGRTTSTFAWGQEIWPGLGVGVALNNLYTGTFTARDTKGHAFGEYSNYQNAIAASVSYKIAYASFGTTLKYLTDNLQGSETFANGYAIDFGALFDVFDLFRVGMQIQNASGFMFWNTARSDIMNLPWKIRVGFSTQILTSMSYSEDRSTVTGEIISVAEGGNALTLGLDFAYSQYSVAPIITVGAEYEAHQYLTFRGGLGIYGDNYGKPCLFPMNNWGVGLTIYPDIEFINDNLPFTLSIDYTVGKELINATGINHSLALNLNF